MLRLLRILAASVALTAGVTACAKKSSEKAGGDSTESASSTKKTDAADAKASPAADEKSGGSALPQEITLTQAQVEHGKIKWSPVTIGTVNGVASAPAQLEVNEDRTARVGAPARGRVVAVRVRSGDRVGRGQVLVSLQSPDAGMAQADVSKATSAVTSARAQLSYLKAARDRAERLLALKAMPRQDYEKTAADYQFGLATLQQAEAEFRRARNAAQQLGAVTSGSGEIALRSPVAGVVLTRSAVPGSVVEAGAPLVVVTDPSQLWLAINAPEKLSGIFHRGSRLKFTVPAYPTEIFQATIEAVGAGLDSATRTLPIRASVINSAGRLKPEMFATVTVENADGVSAALVPDEAVQLIDGKPTVFLVKPDADGKFKITRREVQIGPRSAGKVAITRGLSSGEIIVTEGAFAVKARFTLGSMQMED